MACYRGSGFGCSPYTHVNLNSYAREPLGDFGVSAVVVLVAAAVAGAAAGTKAVVDNVADARLKKMYGEHYKKAKVLTADIQRTVDSINTANTAIENIDKSQKQQTLYTVGALAATGITSYLMLK